MGNKSVITIMFCVLILVSILISHARGESAPTSRTISSFGSVHIELSRLHTDGRWIRNAAGNVVRLKGAAVFWNFMYASEWYDYDPLSYETEINETSLDLFASSSANFIRLTVNGYIWEILKAPKYIAAVDTVIQWCKERGIMVVLDNHGWWNPDADAVYKTNEELAAELTEWKQFMVELAERYISEPTVIGFDMLNEPGKDIGRDTWRPNVLEVCQAIHEVDPNYLCFLEPLGSSAETDDMENFKSNPLPEPNIVYCAHNYYSWDYPWFDYAKNYGDGNFELAKEQMEALYYERWIDMIEVDLPVMNMETGVYRDYGKNPNWDVWENDTLTLYEKYGVGVSCFPFDPDRSDSSLISILNSDRRTLTNVGEIWAMHMAVTP